MGKLRLLGPCAGVAAVLCVVSSASAGPITFSETGPGLNDIDNETAVSVTQVVGTAGIITDLNISITTDRNFAEEVTYSLSKDGGPSVVFWDVDFICFDDLCPSDATMTLTFDDEAARPLVESDRSELVVGGTFQPSGGGPLSVFDGIALAGTWRLTMIDTVFEDDGTDLFSWTLFGNGEVLSLPALTELPEPGTLALFGLGLAGLSLAARRQRRPFSR